MTSEQLEAARAERMRQTGLGTLTLEVARTWMEETGLCLYHPKRQFSSSVAPSFLEAVAGQQAAIPNPAHIALAEELLVRLELDGVAVRLNLLGQPGEQPDFIVAAWVLPYVYALRGDRDWRRSPQLTGSRQVSQLAVLAYKFLEAGDLTIAQLKHALGREVSETAVLRAITELWQQLRIIPIISAPGQAAKWQLLRTRFQRAIAEGASTSQVTAISVLASIYLQAVIAASMEEVEMFLAPLTARSKIREVLRGLVATRQVHTISLGHAPQFYVAGTLPEFEIVTSVYTSATMPASAYFLRNLDREEDSPSAPVARPVVRRVEPSVNAAPARTEDDGAKEQPAHRMPVRKAATAKPAASRPHFSRPTAHARDRKPGQSAGSRPARRSADARPAAPRSPAPRSANGSRPSASARWSQSPGKNGNGNGKSHGSQAAAPSSNGTHSNGTHSKGTSIRPANANGNGKHHPDASSANSRNRTAAASPTNGNGKAHATKPTATTWSQRNGHANGAKSTTKPGTSARKPSLTHKDVRPDARPARSVRKPALTVGAAAGNGKRFGLTARPKQGTKKRG